MTTATTPPCARQTLAGHDLPLPDILYIMGTGRSGTTILEILLSNTPGVSGVGEVTHIFKDGFINDEICSCGEPASICEQWSAVRKACNWQDSELSLLNQLFVDVAWHTHFPKVALGLISSEKKKLFLETNDCLFRATASVTNSNAVVDSSKYAGRALELARAFPGKTKIICLTRSPAGLVSAFQKTDAAEQKPKSLLGTFLYYAYTMACFRIVAWLLGDRLLRVRYEDMITSPQQTLNKIESWAGIDLSNTKNILKEKQWLEAGHIVTGNRLRRQGRVKFRPGKHPPRAEGFFTRSVISLMNFYRSLLGF